MFPSKSCNNYIMLAMFRIIIFWFGDSVAVSHFKQCNLKVRAMSALITNCLYTLSCRELSTSHTPENLKHGRSLTVMPWTTMDEFNAMPNTQRISLASFHIPMSDLSYKICPHEHNICLIISSVRPYSHESQHQSYL